MKTSDTRELLLLLATANLCWCTGSAAQDERFEEDMLIRPLPDGNILTHMTLRTSTGAAGHYGMFPKVVGEIIDTYGVGEFHVTFSRGQWVGQRWGSPPVSAPQGVELWAWFTPSVEGSQKRSAGQLQIAWRGLTNALAGLLGASLNLLESDTHYVRPRHSVRPQSGVLRALWSNDDGKILAPESHVFLGSLPREIACTENLTPWGKLLPCRQRAGLAFLLRVRVLDALGDVLAGLPQNCRSAAADVQRSLCLHVWAGGSGVPGALLDLHDACQSRVQGRSSPRRQLQQRRA